MSIVIDVEWEELEPVLSLDDALQPNAIVGEIDPFAS